MLRLVIEDKEVELNESVQVAITKQFEDLSNPTTIINDWSKTVSIPFTQNNHKLFGHIYNPDKVTIYTPTSSNLLNAPSSIKKWDGSDYEDDSLVDGEIVCDEQVTYLQLGFQYQDWKYSSTKKFECNNDYHTYEFVYDATKNYRLEFSLRDLASSAPNNEVYLVQWNISDLNLVEGETYIISFRHRSEGDNYIIYDFTLTKGVSLTGIRFDPYKKLSMRLQWNDDVMMTGYAKMNEVKQVAGKGTYEITLFGQLGKILQELKKISFDDSADDTTYLIHGERYVDEYITKDLVHDSWTSSSQTQEEVKEKGDANYKVTDIIGFAPSNASKEGFDFTTFQAASEGEGASLTFQETLEKGFEGHPTFEEVTGISPSTIIPNGIYPRAIGEYRSYLQLPYIYWNKLFQIFQDKAESLTGYKFKLDSKWFNKKNPYWYDLVYMLKQFDIKDGGTSLNTYKSIGHHYYADTIPPNTEKTVYEPNILADGAFAYRYIYDGTKTQWTTQRNIPITSNHYEKTESVPLVQDNMRLKLSPNERVVTQAMQVKGVLEVYFGLLDKTYKDINTWKGFFYSPDVVTCINLKFTGANGTVRRQLGAVLQRDASSPCRNYANSCEASFFIPKNPLRPNRVPNSSPVEFRRTGSEWDFTLNFPETNLFYSEFGEYVTISLETYCWFPEHAAAQMPYGRQNYTNSDGQSALPPAFSSKYQFGTIANFNSELRITSGIFRSGSKFTLNDLWNKDVSVFDEILRYCKMFRIGVKVDEVNKQLMFTPIERYFSKYTVTDWTNKIDKSRDFTITPITFEDKYVLFNYEDGKTKNGKVYKEKYGLNYGEYRLTTDYNFNNKTNKLFDKQKPSNVISPIVLTWDTLYRDNKIVYRIPVDECYIDDGDDDNKVTDTFGQFYFHNGLKAFTKTDMPSVMITDDTKLMSWNQTYFYTGGFYEADTYVVSETYPYLSLYRGDNMITYAVPKECYVSNTDYSTKKGIYDNLWKTYLNERYNLQNKKITCYVDIKPTEFSTFDWSKLVKVGNQLCIVNKIYDYDVTSSQPTKVDLITIQNVKGYTTNEFLDNLDTIELDWTGTLYISGNTGASGNLGHVSSLSQVTFSNGTTTYTVGGVTFTIVDNNTIHYETVSKYVDKEDLDMNITLKNESGHTATLPVVRYSTYPYPWIIVEDANGNEVSTLPAGSLSGYKLKWHGTETEGLENKPTVTVSIAPSMSGTGVTIDNNSWTEDIVMIQEGDDEWFKTEYSVNLSYTLMAQQKVQITVVDKEGWHETRTYTVQ